MNIPGPTPAQKARFAATLDALHPPGRPIVVGVSGGPDSLALLLLLASIRHGETIAATVDHRLREESKAEALGVAAICKRIGIHHRILPVKVPEDGQGLQASAREVRYEALGWYCRHKGATALATAHHVDDQAETVLMRLARGAGVAGLAGVRDRRPLEGDICLIRPLLGWQRAELAAIVAAARIEAVDDPANSDARFDRTRARALMTQGWFEPARLAAVARHMADADEALDWAAQALLAERFTAEGEGAALDPAGLPRELLRRVVIAAIARLCPEGETPRGDELARLLDRLEGGHVSTLGRLQVTPGTPWRFAKVAPHRA